MGVYRGAHRKRNEAAFSAKKRRGGKDVATLSPREKAFGFVSQKAHAQVFGVERDARWRQSGEGTRGTAEGHGRQDAFGVSGGVVEHETSLAPAGHRVHDGEAFFEVAVAAATQNGLEIRLQTPCGRHEALDAKSGFREHAFALDDAGLKLVVVEQTALGFVSGNNVLAEDRRGRRAGARGAPHKRVHLAQEGRNRGNSGRRATRA